MKTLIVHVDPELPNPDVIDSAAVIIRRGGLVAFPTETVYGLGADALNPQAISKLYQVKGRPSKNPLIVHVPDPSAVIPLVAEWPPSAKTLSDAFWPGPLTIVVKKSPWVPDIVTAGGETVGIRIPAHPVALALLKAADVPVAAPSANKSSRVSPTRAQHVIADFDGQVDMILDAGPTTQGLESTVLDLTCTPPKILRPGVISPEMIRSILGDVIYESNLAKKESCIVQSPGQLLRHYSPKTPVSLIDDLSELYSQLAKGVRVVFLSRTFVAVPTPSLVVLPMPLDPSTYGSMLYERLRQADDVAADWIFVEMPPEEDEWVAIRDRLARASTNHK